MNRIKFYLFFTGSLFVNACAPETQLSRTKTCLGGGSSKEAFVNNFEKQNRFIIKISDSQLNADTLSAELNHFIPDASIKYLKDQQLSVEVPLNSGAHEKLGQYLAEKKFIYIEADTRVYQLSTPQQGFPMNNLKKDTMVSSMASEPDKNEVIVAIIDTGIDYNHSDLKKYVWENKEEIPNNNIDDDKNGYVDDIRGWDFANEDPDPLADDAPQFHGTHVAGIIQSVIQTAGLGVNLKIMPLKYLDSSGMGFHSDAVRALDYAIQNGAHIINASWGSRSYSQAIFEQIQQAGKKNILLVAAAGNEGLDIDVSPIYPAAYKHSNIISVTAHDKAKNLLSWSNFGQVSVDLAAPGEKILSTRNGNTYGFLSGTSMAAPYVSAVAASLQSQRPDLSALDLRQIIFQSTEINPKWDGQLSTQGRVNFNNAILLASRYSSKIEDPNILDLTADQCPVLSAAPRVLEPAALSDR